MACAAFWGQPGMIRDASYTVVTCDTDNPNLITFTEKRQSQECLRQHIQCHQYQHLLSIIELSVSEPEIRFYNITQTGRLEVMKTLEIKWVELSFFNPIPTEAL